MKKNFITRIEDLIEDANNSLGFLAVYGKKFGLSDEEIRAEKERHSGRLEMQKYFLSLL